MVGAANRAIGRAYIPAPTWRPIAELPERHPEWLDGRPILVIIDGEIACATWQGGMWDDGYTIGTNVTHYLDLAIPEVPR